MMIFDDFNPSHLVQEACFFPSKILCEDHQSSCQLPLDLLAHFWVISLTSHPLHGIDVPIHSLEAILQLTCESLCSLLGLIPCLKGHKENPRVAPIEMK